MDIAQKFQQNFLKTEKSSSENVFEDLIKQKVIGYEIVKGWDAEMRQNLQLCKKLNDTLAREIEKFSENSAKVFGKGIYSFHKVHSNFEGVYLLKEDSSLLKTKKKPIGSSNEKLPEENSLARAIQKFEKEQAIYEQKVKGLSQLIKKELECNELLQAAHYQENKVKKICDRLTSIKTVIANALENVEESLKKFTSVFKATYEQNNERKRSKHNTLDHFIRFTNELNRVVDLIKEEWGLTKDIFENSVLLEQNRIDALRKSYLKFIQLVSENIGKDALLSFSESMNALEVLDTEKLAKSSLNLDDILLESEKEVIFKRTSSTELTLQTISILINRVSVDNLEELLSFFCIASYSGYLIKSDKKEPIQFFLSVDCYYSLFHHLNGTLSFITKIPIEKSSISVNYDESTCEISYIKKILLWDSSSNLRFEFSRPDLEKIQNIHNHFVNIFSSLKLKNISSSLDEKKTFTSILKNGNSESKEPVDISNQPDISNFVASEISSGYPSALFEPKLREDEVFNRISMNEDVSELYNNNIIQPAYEKDKDLIQNTAENHSSNKIDFDLKEESPVKDFQSQEKSSFPETTHENNNQKNSELRNDNLNQDKFPPNQINSEIVTKDNIDESLETDKQTLETIITDHFSNETNTEKNFEHQDQKGLEHNFKEEPKLEKLIKEKENYQVLTAQAEDIQPSEEALLKIDNSQKTNEEAKEVENIRHEIHTEENN